MESRYRTTNTKSVTHSRVHYLWAVQELNERLGYARATDVAKLLKVTRSAVSLALTQLKSLRLVKEQIPGHYLFLTEKGKKELQAIDNNFHILSQFFQQILRLDEETSIRQACLIEHLLLEDVAKKMNSLLEVQQKNGGI